MIDLNPSPVESVEAFGLRLFLKRDDLLHPDFSGNKARKFHYWLRREFPGVRRILSYGSVQSNALYSLSVLARMRGWELHYYVDHIPSWLGEHPVGNYKGALENGTRFFVGEEIPLEIDDETLRIEEGGRQREAEEGIALLGEEIESWRRERGIGRLTVFLPSGTGTTALYLQKYCTLRAPRISVATVPCVGGGDYLREQFGMLERERRFWPRILEPERRYHFGRLYREFWQIWLELYRQTGVEFDLLYDPLGWKILRQRRGELEGEILYLHQGGLRGNESMWMRYERIYGPQTIFSKARSTKR